MALRRSTYRWLAVLAAAVALLVVGSLSGERGPWTPLGVLLLVVAVSVLAVRAILALGRRFFYRLSLRLAFSYFLIGLLPIPMLAFLIWIAATMSVGQFEVFRVDQAIRRIGVEMSSGEMPGVLRARAENGRVADSEIPVFPAKSALPGWIGDLRAPRFVGQDKAGFLATIRIRGGTTEIFALPMTDVLYAAIAQRSGVAVHLATPDAEFRRGDVGLQVRVDESERQQMIERRDDFVYPPEAMPADHSPSFLQSVTWLYTSPPVLTTKVGGRDRTVAIFTRMAWRRALSELFSQGVTGQAQSKWAWITITAVGGFLAAAYLVALLIAFVLVRTITKTVNRLSRATARISSGDFAVRIATRARDQVGDLARSFDSMAASLETMVRERAEREIVDREIEQARTISQRLLPPPGVAVPGFRVETFFEPFAKIGGDYYDFLTTRDGEVAFAVGDVSGHGLPTALLVATAKAAIATLLESGEGGASLFRRLNRLLYESTEARHFMTLALVVDGVTGLELTNAGHPPPYLISGGTVTALEVPALPLGLFDDKDFPTQVFRFSPGDRLVLYSDGIVECRDARDDAFGFERLERILREHARDPLSGLKAAILDAIAAHCAEGVFDDDRTLVICEKV
jgi:serine phosphatase RsbU (regulator of sigma subunit)